jgi:CO/xanthine dehydrogenase Mo-binding subunit
VDSRSQPFRSLGRKTPKVDAIDKVAGRARFGADVSLPPLLLEKVLHSPHAHGHTKRSEG